MHSGTIGKSRSTISAPSATTTQRCTSSRPPSAARWRSRMRALALFLVTALAAGCGDSKSSQPTAAPGAPGTATSPVTFVQPEYRTRTAALETTAKVQFNEEQIVRVNAPVTGRVLDVLARPGEVIEPGHPLFVLDSPDLGQAKSDYAKAVSDLARSEKASKL